MRIRAGLSLSRDEQEVEAEPEVVAEEDQCRQRRIVPKYCCPPLIQLITQGFYASRLEEHILPGIPVKRITHRKEVKLLSIWLHVRVRIDDLTTSLLLVRPAGVAVGHVGVRCVGWMRPPLHHWVIVLRVDY